MSEASLYRELQAHLSTLRLAAAAEALPAELDRAGPAKSSHIAFAEALRESRWTPLLARRQASLARFACLPPRGVSRISTLNVSPASGMGPP